MNELKKVEKLNDINGNSVAEGTADEMAAQVMEPDANVFAMSVAKPTKSTKQAKSTERAKSTKKKKHMTTAKVFCRNLGLTTARLGTSLLGLVIWIAIILVGVLWAWEYETTDPDLYNNIITFNTLVGFIIYYIISKSGKSKFRKKQIIRTIYAFQNDHWLEQGKKTKDVVEDRFTVTSIMSMVKRTLKLLKIMIFKSHNKELVEAQKLEWRRNLADFLAVFLTNIVPILGFCSLSWFISHPEDGILKGALDGLYGIYINKKKLAKRMIFVFLAEAFIIIFLGLALCFLFEYLYLVNEVANKGFTLIGQSLNDMQGDYEIRAMAFLIVIIIKFGFWLYIQSYGMTSVLQIYVKATTENPPGTAPLYTKLSTEYAKLKQKLVEKKRAKADGMDGDIAEKSVAMTDEAAIAADADAAGNTK